MMMQPAAQTMQATVPAGAAPGSHIRVMVPNSPVPLMVTVPPGASPGSQLTLTLNPMMRQWAVSVAAPARYPSICRPEAAAIPAAPAAALHKFELADFEGVWLKRGEETDVKLTIEGGKWGNYGEAAVNAIVPRNGDEWRTNGWDLDRAKSNKDFLVWRSEKLERSWERQGATGAAWDNHFAAFGGQDVEKILQDYSEQSVITVYDQTTGGKTVFRGLDGVRECFVGLFKSLFDLSDLAAPVQVVKEASAGEPGSVFLIWYCPASGYRQATDTFIFDASSKILWQNVVVTYQDPKGDGKGVAKNDTEEATGSGAVHVGWANHFAAFGSQDVGRILQDYTEESEIRVFNHADGSCTVHEGLAGAQRCFEGLFKNLFDCSNLAAPIIHVEESVSGAAGQVFLIWEAPASGYARATDTFIFNSAGKIMRQNVVVHYEARS